MTKFYATTDNDGNYINRDAGIRAFDTLADAEKYLRDANPPEWLDDGVTVEIIDGSFGDCWVKAHKAPRVGDAILSPFNFNDVIIQAPGSHPGGKVYWLTPRPTILVAGLV